MLVAVRADHGYFISVDPDDRRVDRAAAQVENEDVRDPLGDLLILVREGGGDRFSQHVQDIQPGDLTGPPGGLPLRYTEIRGDGDNDIADRSEERRVGKECR